jgi:hypothetical protein
LFFLFASAQVRDKERENFSVCCEIE